MVSDPDEGLRAACFAELRRLGGSYPHDIPNQPLFPWFVDADDPGVLPSQEAIGWDRTRFVTLAVGDGATSESREIVCYSAARSSSVTRTPLRRAPSISDANGPAVCSPQTWIGPHAAQSSGGGAETE